MPIRPENRALYPPNWKAEIVPRIRARSGNRCECTGQCGVAHKPGWWNAGLAQDRCGIGNGDVSFMVGGEWRATMPTEWGEEFEEGGRVYRAVRIVLTVAHLNHDPQDNRDDNLLHMCQGCHNRYDEPMRRAGRMTRRRAQFARGDLFCAPAD